MADIVRSVMKETGISITELLAAAVEVAYREYPSELLKHRDEIVQGLYTGIQSCVECANMEREHDHSSTGTLVSEEESQNPSVDQHTDDLSGSPEVAVKDEFSGSPEVPVKDDISGSPEMAVKEISQQEQPLGRPRLRVIIRLKKNKPNLPVDETERPKSERDIKAIGNLTSSSYNKDEFQNFPVDATERPKVESETKALETSTSNSYYMNGFQNMVLESEEESEIKLENAKRKLHNNYELAALAKKQRCMKVIETNEIPKQEACMHQKTKNGSAKSRIASRLRMMKRQRR